MFTLPFDVEPTQHQVPAGKILQVPTWNLAISITPGTMYNEQWIPERDHVQLNQGNMKFTICLGDQILDTVVIGNKKTVFDYNLQDLGPIRRQLKITLSGKPDYQDDHDRVMFDLDLRIEGLSIMNILFNQGHYLVDSTKETKMAGNFMGENGTTVLEIYTPIYVWLLKHQNFIQQFSQKS